MTETPFLVLERSSQNLQKITRNGKTMLEGIFAEFGKENRNGRIYEEKEYLPHLEYLKQDIKNGNLLGELDHPERFEVALGNVSHRITELWYDQSTRQVKGRIEIIEGTPKGQIAKALLEAGVPLSISSRAAGTVRENKTVSIQQIYTYDLVAKPGFEAAQLREVSESIKATLFDTVKSLNESSTSRLMHSINSKLGILNENVSIISISDKPKIREEALHLVKQNNTYKMENEEVIINENYLQKWTKIFNDRLSELENKVSESVKNQKVMNYVEKIRKIQEDALNWQSEIAVAINKLGNTVDTISERANSHKSLTDKLVETVDYNANMLNKMHDWTADIAKVTNAIGNTVDHNAKMLNGVNEWTSSIANAVNRLNEWGEEKAKAINALHQWGEEKAKAINNMHEWTSSIAKGVNGINEWTGEIAKGVNESATWSHEMLGRTLSKDEALKLLKYVELVAESKSDPKLKSKLDEILSTNSISKKPLTESAISGLITLDKVGKINTHTDTDNEDSDSVYFDKNTNTIISKLRQIKFKGGENPIKMKKNLEMPTNQKPERINGGELENDLPGFKTGLKKTKTISTSSDTGKVKVNASQHNLVLNVKGKKLSESIENILNTSNVDIAEKRNNLTERLNKIQESLEKKERLKEEAKQKYPFIGFLSESDSNRFLSLSETDKKKVSEEISKVPTTDSNVILKLWENVTSKVSVENEPMWLKLAPKAYKEAYLSSPTHIKESINAKSEYIQLNTPYQIQNFWETTGLIQKNNSLSLNEVFSAKSPEESSQKMDSVVAKVASEMKKYMQ